ncbi:MAG: NAD(P)H-dependent oxidoreductase [Cyanobacteria bacterium J083]|nr:MAG: NAD(P)H-dependent oxidoreductase [Cyanobacteria bacterium J083]
MLTPEKVLKQLNWRYAVKKFAANKKIPPEIWQVLEASLVLSPSSFGLQPWKFFIVRNPEIRAKLVEYSWGQRQVVDASHLVVFTIKKDIDAAYINHYVDRMSEVQGVPREDLQKFATLVQGFVNNLTEPQAKANWAMRQTYIALGFFMTCAAMLEVDTCPIEGFVPEKYDEVLNLLAQGYQSAVVCAAGYRAEDDPYASKPKVRFPPAEVVEYID